MRLGALGYRRLWLRIGEPREPGGYRPQGKWARLARLHAAEQLGKYGTKRRTVRMIAPKRGAVAKDFAGKKTYYRTAWGNLIKVGRERAP